MTSKQIPEGRVLAWRYKSSTSVSVWHAGKPAPSDESCLTADDTDPERSTAIETGYVDPSDIGKHWLAWVLAPRL